MEHRCAHFFLMVRLAGRERSSSVHHSRQRPVVLHPASPWPVSSRSVRPYRLTLLSSSAHAQLLYAQFSLAGDVLAVMRPSSMTHEGAHGEASSSQEIMVAVDLMANLSTAVAHLARSR